MRKLAVLFVLLLSVTSFAEEGKKSSNDVTKDILANRKDMISESLRVHLRDSCTVALIPSVVDIENVFKNLDVRKAVYSKKKTAEQHALLAQTCFTIGSLASAMLLCGGNAAMLVDDVSRLHTIKTGGQKLRLLLRFCVFDKDNPNAPLPLSPTTWAGAKHGWENLLSPVIKLFLSDIGTNLRESLQREETHQSSKKNKPNETRSK